MKNAVWHNLYSAAITESNPTKLRVRIQEAEAAMFLRFQDLAENPDLNNERDVLANALSSLRALQRNLLRYPSRQIA